MRSRAGYKKLDTDDSVSKYKVRLKYQWLHQYVASYASLNWGLVHQVEDERFEDLGVEVPVASIALAIFLMIFGMASFVLAWLHITQEILGKEQAVSSTCRSSQSQTRSRQYHGAASIT